LGEKQSRARGKKASASFSTGEKEKQTGAFISQKDRGSCYIIGGGEESEGQRLRVLSAERSSHHFPQRRGVERTSKGERAPPKGQEEGGRERVNSFHGDGEGGRGLYGEEMCLIVFPCERRKAASLGMKEGWGAVRKERGESGVPNKRKELGGVPRLQKEYAERGTIVEEFSRRDQLFL